MATKYKQLTQDIRSELHKKLVNKADRIKEELRNIYYEKKVDEETKEETYVKLERDLTAQEQKNADHLHYRQDQVQMSLRLTHNTVWIDETRREHILFLKKELAENIEKLEQIPVPVLDEDKEEDIETASQIKNLKNKISITEDNIKALEKAAKCKKCYQRGFIGMNISTSEFRLCDCTLKTISIYKLKTD